MHFTSFQEGDKLTIALTGEIDHHCAKAYIMPITELAVAIFVAVMMRRCQKQPVRNAASPDRGA